MKELDLSECETNAEVSILVSERVKELSIQELIDEVNKSFIYLDNVVKVIYTGLRMNTNIFLSGPGGFGKSSLIKHILDIYKIPYNTIVGYKDMPVDALLGVPNMKKLLEESKYEINFKESVFCRPGILIGEEFTDILPSTAAALKDILTEKGYRYKGEKVESLVATMIIAANKTAADMSVDDSLSALYNERFPLQANVVWPSFTADRFYAFLQLVFPNKDNKSLYFMARLFENNFMEFHKIISPRTAIDMTRTFLSLGIDHINGFNVNMSYIDKIQLEAEEGFKKIKLMATVEDIRKEIDTANGTMTGSVLVTFLYYTLYHLKEIRLSGDNIDDVNELIAEISRVISAYHVKYADYSKIKGMIKTLEG